MNKPAESGSQPDATGVVEKLGIKSLGVWLTAAGNMLQFRYIVLDPAKSHPVFDKQLKTYLVEQASGQNLAVPIDTKFGPMRSSSRNPDAGKEYFILFKNFGHIAKRGSKVSIVIGDYRIDNVTVQ